MEGEHQHGNQQQIVMTEAQLETLRRQISVYSTICSQLVEMHKVMSHQAAVSRENMLYDLGSQGYRPSARQRWTPSQTQLTILERLYERTNGTPNKNKIRDITSELSQHGPVSETNVYNWFQNRKARAKRKQQTESEADTDGESSRDKKVRVETELRTEETEHSERNTISQEINHSTHDMGQGKTESKAQIHETSYGLGITGQTFKDTNIEAENQWSSLSTSQREYDCSQNNPMLLDKTDSLRNVAFSNVTGLNGSSHATIVQSGKQCQIPTGIVDVREMFGENAVLLDSQGCSVPTNDSGITFNPLYPSEKYFLIPRR